MQIKEKPVIFNLKTVTKMKNRLFERVLFGVIGLLLILVGTTGYWVFEKLDRVANTPLPTSDEKNSQSLIQDVNLNLLKSENLIYSYIYQNQNEALLDFEILKSKTIRQLGYLKNYQKHNPAYQQTIDQIKENVTKRFENQQHLMQLRNETRVHKTMQLVENEVQQISERTHLELELRKEAEKQAATTVEKNERKSRKERKKAEAEQPIIEKAHLQETEKIAANNANSLKKRIGQVRNVAVEEESNLNRSKLTIEQANVLLSKDIDSLFQNIEQYDRARLIDKTKQAKEVAQNTNTIIVAFSAISIILISFIVYLMVYLFRVAKQSNARLKLAKEKSDALTQAKSRFLATMSHEIRTPLNAITGFSEQLTQDHLSDAAAQKATVIYDSSKHLNLIVNEILDLSKLEENNVKLEETNFRADLELKRVVNQLSIALNDQGNRAIIHVNNEPFPNLLGDPLRFKQILINLLSNANKFTKKGDIQLNLSFESIDATHGNCIFSIQDEGIGMSSEQVERIFEPFEQAETSTSRKYGGTGLGLSITKRIVEKMNGSITVNSVMNQGTHFFVTIPMKKSTEEAEQAKPYTPDFSFLANKNILIVDDEPFNRLLLNGLLKSSTAHIFEAENGVKALEIIANEQIDLLLLDVQMPEMNGEEVVQHVLEHHPDAFPIVGLTATLDVEQQHLMLKRGWSDVLIKPIVPKTLEETLKKQMNQHGK